jgi:hypothetical protein
MKFAIAVDFDGTLFEHQYPNIGAPKLNVIEKVKEFQNTGKCEILLWTCREDKSLDEAVEICNKFGIKFDAVNDNSPRQKEIQQEMFEQWGIKLARHKIYADFYVDDKAYGSIETFLGVNVNEFCSRFE